ncbi:hypothetical protein HYD48_00895 [Mycoplasmopsis bovis]|nr:hypothetical protein [Mycoplasmopsis bovis]QQH77682.1 hypothetical protein HYD48_00895 [Mycoplasmopsis bovis]
MKFIALQWSKWLFNKLLWISSYKEMYRLMNVDSLTIVGIFYKALKNEQYISNINNV